MAERPYTLRKEDLLMVEWLLATYSTMYDSLLVYVSQIQQGVSEIVGNQFLLWTVVVLFVLALRWLTQPRNGIT